MAETTASAKCRRCGRKLTSAASVARGLGPTCAKAVSKTDLGRLDPWQAARVAAIFQTGVVEIVKYGNTRVVKVQEAPYLTDWADLDECGCSEFRHEGACPHFGVAQIVLAGRAA
jgi:hypothetical protein